jgi:hypothetical protein
VVCCRENRQPNAQCVIVTVHLKHYISSTFPVIMDHRQGEYINTIRIKHEVKLRFLKLYSKIFKNIDFT